MANKSKSSNKTDSKKLVAFAGAGVVAAAVGAGGYGLGVATTDGLRDASENYSISQQEYASLEKSISSLKTRKSTDAIPEYSRSSLPTDWRDLDGNGCNTREDVLKDNLRKYARFDGCKVTSGTLYDYYNGKILKYNKNTDAGGGIQIDHIVAIGNAWISGGYNWTDDTWVAYVNDKDVLIPTASSTNREKSDKDITEWQPANSNFICAYMKKQVEIKKNYNLTVTAEEKATFKNILQTNCTVSDD